MSVIAIVVISGATREFDRKYHYLVPESLKSRVIPGVRVIVPFGGGNSPKEGYVFGFAEETEYTGLKEIRRVIDGSPVISRKLISLAEWMKDRYICTYSDAVKCMLPAGIGIKSHRIVRLLKRAGSPDKNLLKVMDILAENNNEMEFKELRKLAQVKSFQKHISALEAEGCVGICEEYTTAVREKNIRVACLAMPYEEVLSDIETNVIKRIQQIRVLELLGENGIISAADLMHFAGVSSSVLNTLRKYGYIKYMDVEVNRDPAKHLNIERTFPLQLTQQQSRALSSIKSRLDGGEFSEILLHGVTGSGKTEVYLQAIQYVISKGKQAIVLVPEISLTPQMVERFKGRFGDEVAILHSRLSLGERYDQWRLAGKGSVKVVVGARSAVFAPLANPGIIIIDEEHETSYKSETTPKYSAAEIARKRCEQEGAVLIYGSATPSVETYYKAQYGRTELIELTERANKMDMPAVRVADMRKELEAGNRTIFSSALSREIIKNMESGQQTILFLNRRGYASFVLCRNCGTTIKCPNCNITLTYHSFDGRLICHYCGHTVKMPETCPRCGSRHIRNFGTGTQKVEEEIKKHFQGCTVIRMDMDTTTGKNSHEKILTMFREQNINILVGTQMIAKGHDFPNVTLVGVLAADSLLNLDDFKASERTFQLITQVAGRAGRGGIPGRVIIQAYDTDNFSIITACSHDYASFYKQEIGIREKLGYPPFTNIAVAVISAVNDRLARSMAAETCNAINGFFKGYGEGVLVLGPMRAPLTRIRNMYRWRIVIKCVSEDKLIDVLRRTTDGFRKTKGKSNVFLNVAINPVSML